MKPMKLTVMFEHTSGGDSLLPKQDRGFFDNYEVVVEATTLHDAEQLAMAEMHARCSDEHPDWPNSAIDDLSPDVQVDLVSYRNQPDLLESCNLLLDYWDRNDVTTKNIDTIGHLVELIRTVVARTDGDLYRKDGD